MTRHVIPTPVEPIGSHESGMFVDRADPSHWSGMRGSFEVGTVKDYPPSPRGAALRALRERTPMSMGDAARWFSVTVVQWSGFERGTWTMSPEDWDFVEGELRKRV